jgi:hypothetical protein
LAVPDCKPKVAAPSSNAPPNTNENSFLMSSPFEDMFRNDHASEISPAKAQRRKENPSKRGSGFAP